MSNSIQLTLRDRLYVQLVPDDSSVAPLVHLQGILRESGIKGQFVDPSRLHMTILHIGELGRTYEELKMWVPKLTEPDFLESAAWLRSQLEQLFPATAQITLQEMALFGADLKTIAMNVEVPVSIERLHGQALSLVTQFFTRLGVEYVEAFMKSSYNYKHALTLSPHISLMKHADNPRKYQVNPIVISTKLSPIFVQHNY